MVPQIFTSLDPTAHFFRWGHKHLHVLRPGVAVNCDVIQIGSSICSNRTQHLVHGTLESDGGSKQAECDRSVKRRSIWTLNFHCSTFVICNLSESYSSLEKLYEQPEPFKKLFLYSAALVAALLKNGKVLLLKQVLTNYFPKSDISKA